MPATVEVLVERTWKGGYDFTFDARLVRRGDKYYLVMDHYCGQDGLEGGCPRPFLYEVPVDLLDETRVCIERHDEVINTDPYADRWARLMFSILPDLKELGRKSKYKWAADL